MATFYVLPSRHVVGQRFAECLEALFPGLGWEPSCWLDLAEALGTAARGYPEVYVLFREDLADDADLHHVLFRDFGAEKGDRIIEVGGNNLPLPGQLLALRHAA